MSAAKRLALIDHMALGDTLAGTRALLVSTCCRTKNAQEREIIARLIKEITTSQSLLDNIVCAAIPRARDPKNLACQVYYPDRNIDMSRREILKIYPASIARKSVGTKMVRANKGKGTSNNIVPFREVGKCLPSWLHNQQRLTRLQVLRALFGNGKYADRSFTSLVGGTALFVDLVTFEWMFGADDGQGLTALIVRVFGKNVAGTPQDVWCTVTGEAPPYEDKSGGGHD